MPLQGGGQPFPEQLIRHRKTRHQPHQPSISSEIGNACAHGCGSAIGRTILRLVIPVSPGIRGSIERGELNGPIHLDGIIIGITEVIVTESEQ